jgi:glycine betaine/choline ABC-type transport system substrate-binding protein
MAIAGVFGTSFETILPMTAGLTMTAAQAVTNLVVGTSGMPDTLTLPAISAMVASQNREIQVTNKSSSGGTITVAAASGDAIVGRITVAVSTGTIYRHDGLHSWFSTS